jgi:hypothetical protein
MQFAAACVLYDPPLERAPAFADYGGLPLLPGEETGDESVPGVLIEHDLREGEVDLRVQNDINYEISEKVWELRSKLGEGNFEGAMSNVRSVYHRELDARRGLLKRHWYEWEAELDPPRYHVPFDPTEDTKKDVDRLVKAINDKLQPRRLGGSRRTNFYRSCAPSYWRSRAGLSNC